MIRSELLWRTVPERSRVLDVGCGTSEVLRMLSKQIEHGVGVDISVMFPRIVGGLNAETFAIVRAALERHHVLFAGYGADGWNLRQLLLGLDGVVWTD
jgi:hypothetical protein